MAMFLFPHNGLVLLLIGYISVILQNGLITNSKSVDATRGIIPITDNFLQIQRPPVKRLLVFQNVSHYLPCSASINYTRKQYDNHVSLDRIVYIWYRNGIEISTLSSRRTDFQVFSNGTLRLPTNEKSTGVYRCLVNATAGGHHALLSESVSVEYAVFKRTTSHPNITATSGMPITLSCPVKSVPTANVSWSYGNVSIEKKFKESRFITLTNGSLVLKNITDADRGKYKCKAQNSFALKKERKFVLTVNVIPPKIASKISSVSPMYTLLPPLQDEVHYIPSRTDIELRCFATSNAIIIEWWFQKTLEAQLEKIANNSMELSIHEATFEKHDGYYTCKTRHDSQLFRVIVTDPPVIIQPLESYESALAAFVSYSCPAVGNPPPEFSWYRNGKLLTEYSSYTINIQRNTLTIKSFDLNDVGIYQCFARNIAGETYSAALLRLPHRDVSEVMPKPLRNVRCYALNSNTINVTFHSGSSPYFISVHIARKNPYSWESRNPVQPNHTEYLIISGQMPIYKPFVILTRALLKISSIRKAKGGAEENIVSSFLSEPAHCCTQGLPIRAYHLSPDVFVMWVIPVLKIKYFIIQFSIAFTQPYPREFFKEPNLRGISSDVKNVLMHDDIANYLQEVIPLTESQARDVLNKAQSTRNDSDDYNDLDEEVFSLVVPSNVTGLLLRNCLQAKIRVLVVTNENEDLQQDFRYVQWKTIENDTEMTATIPFKVSQVEARSITITFVNNFTEKCLHVCHFVYESPDISNTTRNCDDMTPTSSKLVLRELHPKKHYKVLLYSCNKHYSFGEVEVQTLPDPPGTITNHKVTKQDGLILRWDPPTNPNGKIHHHSIFWTVNNTTHEANVSSTENFFKFPNITESAKINITIRVVGENGAGAPIFIDLRNISPDNIPIDPASILDTYWGVVIGVALSTVCILIFTLICIYQRHRFKLRSGQTQLTSQSESNIGAVSTPGAGCVTDTSGLGGFLGDSGGGLSGGLGETSALNEYHEMQTLIPKSQQFEILKDMSAAPKQLPNGNGSCPRRNENSSECIFAETELDENPIALCSSTPLPIKPKQRKTNECNDDELFFIPVAAKNHRRNIAAEYPPYESNRFALNKISSSPNFFNGGSSSVVGGCRPSALTDDCSRQRHNNRHSQWQPAAMQNGCSHYVNTTNNRNSCSSSNNNNKIPPPQPQTTPLPPHHQLNHSIDNGAASLSDQKLLLPLNNGEEKADPKNRRPCRDSSEVIVNRRLHPTDGVPNLDRNDGNLKICTANPALTNNNNNNTLSWHNKQQPPTELTFSQLHQHQDSSKAPLIETSSTIGYEASSSAAVSTIADSHPSSSSDSSISSHNPNPPNHHHNQEAESSANPLLKTNWSHRRPNVDPNG